MILSILFFFCVNYSNALFGGRYAMPSVSHNSTLFTPTGKNAGTLQLCGNARLSEASEVTSMVSIRTLHATNPAGTRGFCGGALISENTVLTAAHCVYKNEEFVTVADITVNDYNTNSADLHESKRQTKAIDIMPNYPMTLDVQDDIAILYLPSPVDYCNEYGAATVARLPPSPLSQLLPADPLQAYYNSPLTDNDLFSLSFCSISSWGIVETGNFSDLPMNLVVTLQKSEEPNTFLATTPYGRFCQGDSGSPVFCTIRGKPYLVGIMSEVGSFDQSKIGKYDKMTSLEKCAAFDHAKIVDIRARMPLIHQILKKRRMEKYLAEGQRHCNYN